MSGVRMINYDREKLNEIKSKIDYFEFYKKYLPDLKYRGKLAWALCCFHGDKNPSLSVDTEYGVFRCWSCGIYGDVFSFYSKYHNISFTETVEQLAKEYNVELSIDPELKKELDYKNALYSINKTMSEKYQISLKGNNSAWNYLTTIRGLTPKIINDFKIGCGINTLPNKESLKTLGLLKESDNGLYSTFRSDRIVFPRIDENGRVVSFTGRLHVEKENSPKYLHCVDTPIYKKSDFLFGLYQAKRYIKKLNSVICVEGNLDVIKMHQKGLLNTIGLDGLNISDSQVNLLKKYTNTFYLCVEDDAILRINETDRLSPLDKIYNKIKEYIPYAKVYVVDLRNKDGSKCDPDMYLEKNTKNDFLNLIQHAKVYNEYIISSKLSQFNPRNIEEKTACINCLIPLLSNISNFLDRKQYIELVANKLLIPENDIYRKIKIKLDNKEIEKSKNITWDNRPVYAQKILLSTCFAPNFDNKKAVLLLSLHAESLMESFYKNIFNDLVKPYIQKSETDKIDFNEFFTELNYNEDISELVKKTIMDIYVKIEQFEDFNNNDLESLIQEQCETLQEWSVPQNNIINKNSLTKELENICI